LLNEEEIEEVEVSSISKKDLTKIENWCNNFAYYFLIGDFKNTIDNIENATASNDYNFNLIEHISKETHLSTLALFTRLLYSGKISRTNYQNVKDDLDYKYQQKIDEEKKQKELDKLAGIKRGGSVPKPINSPLFVNTLQSALYGGIINEYDFCRQLNIKPDKIQQYI
jgi:Zn-dependent peptidase ImmA (M78 family)